MKENGLPRNHVWQETVNLHLGVLENMGYALPCQSKVLDLGTGAGDLVAAYRERAFQCWGCDVKIPETPVNRHLREKGFLKELENSPYRLPFPAETFELVVTNQVLEHVQDHARVFAEMNRVLKPGGVTLHVFPSRYRLVEAHIRVPLASIIQTRWWLFLWASLGIRSHNQKGLTASVVARRNHHYLRSSTNYLSGRRMEKMMFEHFSEVSFCEHSFLKNSSNCRGLNAASGFLPFIPKLYGIFRRRMMISRKKAKE